MARLIFLLILIIFNSCPLGASQVVNTYGYRFSGSCASWLSNSSTKKYGEIYIAGLWSGMNLGIANAGRRGNVGSSTDLEGILAEIELMCIAQPSLSLSEASVSLFFKFENRGR